MLVKLAVPVKPLVVLGARMPKEMLPSSTATCRRWYSAAPGINHADVQREAATAEPDARISDGCCASAQRHIVCVVEKNADAGRRAAVCTSLAAIVPPVPRRAGRR